MFIEGGLSLFQAGAHNVPGVVQLRFSAVKENLQRNEEGFHHQSLGSLFPQFTDEAGVAEAEDHRGQNHRDKDQKCRNHPCQHQR